VALLANVFAPLRRLLHYRPSILRTYSIGQVTLTIAIMGMLIAEFW
jgi:hypothetical protein